MDMGGPLGEVLTFADSIRGHATELFGPFAGTITLASQGLAAVLALLLLAAGRGLWSPSWPDLKNFPARFAGLIGLAGLVFLYVKSKEPTPQISFLWVALSLAALVAVSGLVYAIGFLMLCFSCPHDRAVYVRGLKLDPEAKRYLYDPTYQGARLTKGKTRPIDDKQYFCGFDKTLPQFIWTPGSLIFSRVILLLLYVPFAVSLILFLASAAFAIDQVRTTVVETPTASVANLPSDTLFSFGKASIEDAATPSLEMVANLIRKNWKSGPVVIRGYADEIGDPKENIKLSRERAQNVANWLAKEGGLPLVPFDVQGLGISDPVAPNRFADGSDNPDGRRRNRRVVVIIPK
jgi:outer membrane protein OmpA-like peptidoglycan-associated protein